MMSNKIWDDPRLTAYVLGELQGADLETFKQRLEDDESLRIAVAQAREVTEQVSRFFHAEEVPAQLSTARQQIVQAAIEVKESVVCSPVDAVTPTQGVLAVRRFDWMKGLAVAASLMLVAGLSVAMWSGRQGRPVTLSDATDLKVQATQSNRPSDLRLSSTADVPTNAPPLSGERDNLHLGLSEAEAAPVKSRGATVGRFVHPEMASSQTEPKSEVPVDGLAVLASSPPTQQVTELKNQVWAEGKLGGSKMPGTQPRNHGGYGGAVGSANNTSGSPPAAPESSITMPTAAGVVADSSAGKSKPALLAEGVDEARRPSVRYAQDKSSRGRGVVEEHLARGEPRELRYFGMAPELDAAGDRFEKISDNEFQRVSDAPLSTFSIDVDTASYAKVRQFLLEANRLPRPDAVRIEELVNYFDYGYAPPPADSTHPFAVHVEVAQCPWNNDNRLARVALKGRELSGQRPQANLVFLLDVSGSMEQPNKLPLVIRGMKLLLGQLQERDRVAIVVYAGAAGLVLDSTPLSRRQEILSALDRLKAGGSTNGGEGIRLAYALARDHFVEGGVNRVILCTDGDFNVGTTGNDELLRLIERESKDHIFLSILGFGMGNHNDAMLEQVSNRGNGNYAFIDTAAEARKVLVHQLSGTLVTIAKDVKIQIEFNPLQVSGYRLIGYENRVLAAQDFNNDKKDAGEIGAGHEVTALYELVPAGKTIDPVAPSIDPLRYQQRAVPTEVADSKELMMVKLRYKEPTGTTSVLLEHSVSEVGGTFEQGSETLRFAAAVAGFGMQLRNSPYKGKWQWSDVLLTAQGALGNDKYGLRSEFLELVQTASTR